MAFYHFSQNNSGGSFSGPRHVVIEAKNASEANYIAEQNDIYFDGCKSGIDCPCCGDRWSEQWSDDDSNDQPCVYDEPIEFTETGTILVVYKNGEKKLGKVAYYY